MRTSHDSFSIVEKHASQSNDKRQIVICSFISARVTGQFILPLNFISKWELFLGLDFKSNVLYKSIASKNIQSDTNYVSKLVNCVGKLGLWWMSPSKAQANEVERMPTTNGIVLFRLPAIWTRKARHGTKIYEQWQGPKKRARVNNLVKWDRGWRHKYTKQSRVLRYNL